MIQGEVMSRLRAEAPVETVMAQADWRGHAGRRIAGRAIASR
jgi:hypothetical protein